jgi:8-oxo-dGTP pyrophosphatase MutT (NUDIX family)
MTTPSQINECPDEVESSNKRAFRILEAAIDTRFAALNEKMDQVQARFDELTDALSRKYGKETKGHDQPTVASHQMTSEDIAKKAGYEGAAILLASPDNKLLFLLSVNKKTGVVEAEVPGGKPEIHDRTAIETATRELHEEAGAVFAEGTVLSFKCELKTSGGNTGLPSIQLITDPIPESSVTIMRRENFTGHCWARVLYVASENKWCLANEARTPIRKFNTFFLAQHKDGRLQQFIDVVAV